MESLAISRDEIIISNWQPQAGQTGYFKIKFTTDATAAILFSIKYLTSQVA